MVHASPRKSQKGATHGMCPNYLIPFHLIKQSLFYHLWNNNAQDWNLCEHDVCIIMFSCDFSILANNFSNWWWDVDCVWHILILIISVWRSVFFASAWNGAWTIWKSWKCLFNPDIQERASAKKVARQPISISFNKLVRQRPLITPPATYHGLGISGISGSGSGSKKKPSTGLCLNSKAPGKILAKLSNNKKLHALI